MPLLNTSPVDVRSLARLRDEAAAQQAELVRVLRNTKVTRQEAALSNGVRLTKRERLVAICLTVTTEFKAEPATAWLLRMKKKKKYPGIAAQAWTEAAEDAVLGATDAELAMHVAPIAEEHARAVKEACRWKQGWEAAAWVAALNADHGLAPSTRSVVEKARAAAGAPGLHSAEAVTAPAAPVPDKLRKWGMRGRRCFRAGLGKFSAHDQPSASELHAKVGPGPKQVAPISALSLPKIETGAAKAAAKTRPFSGLEKRPAATNLNIKSVRFPAAKMGSRK